MFYYTYHTRVKTFFFFLGLTDIDLHFLRTFIIVINRNPLPQYLLRTRKIVNIFPFTNELIVFT